MMLWIVEKRAQFKRNAMTWNDMALEAMKRGSTDKNICDFISNVVLSA